MLLGAINGILQKELQKAQVFVQAQKVVKMVGPLVAALPAIAKMVGNVASGANRLYRNSNNARIYKNEYRAAHALDTGYDRYLARHNLTQNPNRAWYAYYGKAQKAEANFNNTVADTFATGIGTASRILGGGLFNSADLTRIYNRL